MADTSRPRIRALDGLRGLAALVVLIHHSILASSPKLAILYGSPSRAEIPARGSLNWLVFYTPLHIFWAGPEFVAVFFVLSGFVLSIPLAAGKRVKITSYYPSRLLRLYLPVWAALGFAALMHVVLSHAIIPGASGWLNGHHEQLSWHALLHGIILGPQAGSWSFNTVLWTMWWIVLFALLFPLLSLIPFAWRAARLTVALVCFGFLMYGTNSFSLEMPPFVLGIVLAFEQDSIQNLAKRWEERSGSKLLIKTFLGVSCISLLTADRWIRYDRATLTLVVLGACLAVICAIVIISWRKFFESHPMQWVGTRAFSLYLVHDPIVVALAFLTGASLAPSLFVILALIASLSVCSLFFRLVERPTHSFARDAGIKCEALLSPSSWRR